MDPTSTTNESTGSDYIADVTFESLGLPADLLLGLQERGYRSPTPVQAKAYPLAAAGRHLVVRSKTGTGKTAAFGLPLLSSVTTADRAVKALVLCPTRELAVQVSEEITALGTHRGVGAVPIYGGASMRTQEDALKRGAPIVVGTPGRIQDHLRRGTLRLNEVTHVVLDEADEMLNQGFYEDVVEILKATPNGRQILLFSATLGEGIQRLVGQFATNPETLLLSGDVYTVEHIQHVRYDVSDAFPKPRNLLYLLEIEQPDNAIIFCNTRDDTELVTAVLNRHGFEARCLNGDLPQKDRERVMAELKSGEIAFMVATDLAARGIDISELTHVVNYSLPEDPAVYLHRVGRTGRIGKKGVALNLVTGRELSSLTALEKKYQIAFEKRTMPNADDASRMWTNRQVAVLNEAAMGSVYEGYLDLARDMMKRDDAPRLVAFLLKSFFQKRRGRSGAEEAAPAPGAEAPAPKEASGPPGRRSGARQRSSEARSESSREDGRASRSPAGAQSTKRGRPAKAADATAPGQAKLWVNVGKADGGTAESIGQQLAALVGSAPGSVGRVDVLDSFSFVFVANEAADTYVSLTGRDAFQKVLKVERSRR